MRHINKYLILLATSFVLLFFSPPLNAQSLSEPLHEDSFISEWTAQKIKSLFTLSHENYNEQTLELRSLFIPAGYARYMMLLKSSHTLNQLDLKSADMSPILLKPPRVCMRDISVNNEILWAVSAPVSLKYKRQDTTGEYTSPPHKITMIIRRSNVQTFPDKIAIDQVSFSKDPIADVNEDLCHADNIAREILLFLKPMPESLIDDVRSHLSYYSLKYGEDGFTVCHFIETMPKSLHEKVRKYYNLKRCELQKSGQTTPR